MIDLKKLSRVWINLGNAQFSQAMEKNTNIFYYLIMKKVVVSEDISLTLTVVAVICAQETLYGIPMN